LPLSQVKSAKAKGSADFSGEVSAAAAVEIMSIRIDPKTFFGFFTPFFLFRVFIKAQFDLLKGAI
jgi:hypothetical protein